MSGVLEVFAGNGALTHVVIFANMEKPTLLENELRMTRKTKPVSWIKLARREFDSFPQAVEIRCLAALTIATEGGMADICKPLHGVGSGVFEIALPFRGDAQRITGDRPRQDPVAETQGDAFMKSEDLEIERGSGNVFRDLGHDNADAEQLKAILAAEIIKILDRDGLTVRAAHGLTGFAAADFSRIRNADLGRFTIDRLMSVLNRLGSRIEFKIKVRRVESPVDTAVA